ncbi:hypothetical protein DN35_3468 [Vibrio cholerae]|uniref:hypothetical protein n=1 Tax=Vibrio cholerae TaxID=666 RepID=UPI0004E2D15B|nr:hypothetical protein [Vibrio cholerae]KFE03973.1 hypothetical protein DN35_3468 [Vibrio cholerae]GHZ57418.1 hypothetical protein VCSRO31_3513 [Vibrio cholerae]
MEVVGSAREFAEWIGEIIRFDLSENEDSYVFSRDSFGQNFSLEIEKHKLDTEIDNLSQLDAISETVLGNSNSYEILVREEGQYSRFFPRSRGVDTLLEIEDTENGMFYSLGRPSNAFSLYLIQQAASFGEARALSRPMMNRSMMSSMLEGEPCGFDVLKRFLAGRLTLKVTSSSKRTSTEFDKFSSAFLFNISYNTDSALVQQRDFDELLRAGRITRTRRSNIDEIDPPRRTYVPDLIHHYQLAVGTENPMLEYISYYHIAEHFFESIFTEALVEQVKSKITHPDFSYKRKKDISSLIRDIGKSIKMRDEEITFNEQEGLRLTLKKHVNISDLVVKINEYDNSLLQHYRTNAVPFSGAQAVNLEGDDEELIFKHLAARIYKNRNSIVHSKESEKSKYTPFRDDKTLVKEVPLIRFISEQIIFSTSSIA